MSEYCHIVPWYNSEEWHRAYDLIYSEKPNKHEALNLLLVWKARSPSLPSGIESTLTLLQVSVMDETNRDLGVNDQILRLAYSSAIMRFVNHMLDTETAKGSSLYQAAKNLGVPDWIVDLRHDTAHSNNLPSITLLRDATLIGLEWLRKNYWEKHKQHMQNYITGQKDSYIGDENKIATLMNFCISLSICSHSKCKIKNLADIPNDSMRESIVNDARDLLGHIDMSNLKKVSIASLIHEMNLQSKRLLKTKDTAVHVCNALLGEDSLFLSMELVNNLSANYFKYKRQFNKGYVECFEVLLTFLHTADLLVEFILALIKVTQCEKNNRQALLAALWVTEILVALKKSRDFICRMKKAKTKDIAAKKKKELKSLYHHWFPNEKAGTLTLDLLKPGPSELTDINFIQPIISAYNPNLTYFVKALINLVEPRIPTLVTDKIFQLTELISAPKQFSEISSLRIYTVDDLKTAEESIDLTEHVANDVPDELYKVGNDNNEFIHGIWRLASKKHNWSKCPIGILPWQQRADVVQMEM